MLSLSEVQKATAMFCIKFKKIRKVKDKKLNINCGWPEMRKSAPFNGYVSGAF